MTDQRFHRAAWALSLVFCTFCAAILKHQVSDSFEFLRILHSHTQAQSTCKSKTSAALSVLTVFSHFASHTEATVSVSAMIPPNHLYSFHAFATYSIQTHKHVAYKSQAQGLPKPKHSGGHIVRIIITSMHLFHRGGHYRTPLAIPECGRLSTS